MPRLRAYQAAHPDTTITPPGPDSLLWVARRDGKIIAAEYWLGQLIDDLEWLADGDGETHACSVCGAPVGRFQGYDGWRHYLGEGTAASPVVLYEADHEATPGI